MNHLLPRIISSSSSPKLKPSSLVLQKINANIICCTTLQHKAAHLDTLVKNLLCSSRHSSTTSSSPATIGSNNNLVTFKYDPKHNVGFITLNSPSTFNALTVEMGVQFELLVHDLTKQLNGESPLYTSSDPDEHHDTHHGRDAKNSKKCSSTSIKNMNVIILKGANQNFSSGGDLSWLRKLRHNAVHINADKMYSFYKSFLSVRSLPVPTIAYIQGYAVGAGACLALATDLRVMDEKAKIGFNFVKLGIHSGMGGSHLLSNAIGESRSKFALLTGKVFSAKEAHDIGIAHEIARRKNQIRSLDDEDDQDDDHGDDHNEVVMKLAKQIASMHPLAIRSMVQTTRMREDACGGVGGLDATMRREAYAQALCYAKSDWGEGLDAAIEKRQPDFSDYHDSDW